MLEENVSAGASSSVVAGRGGRIRRPLGAISPPSGGGWRGRTIRPGTKSGAHVRFARKDWPSGQTLAIVKWLLLVLVSLAALAQAPKVEAPARFVDAEGRFAVTVGGHLEKTTHVNETALGQVEEHSFRWRVPGLEWVVNYSDLPGLATASEGLLFLEVRHGFRTTTGNPVTNDREETFLGRPARRFEFRMKPSKTTPKRSGVARVMLVEGRLYVLTVTWDLPELPADRAAETGFFDSFELLKH